MYRRELLNECVLIAESLPEGEGQLARAWHKLHVIYGQQAKMKQSENFKSKASGLRSKILNSNMSDMADSEEAYNELNLWMLW